MSLRTVARAAALSLLTAGAAQAQNLVSNGSFETPVHNGTFLTIGAGSSALTGWAIQSGSVDLINTYWQAANGAQSLDMNGNDPAVLTQMLTTQVGASYTLSFWMAGNADFGWDKAMKVYWNGAQLGGGAITFAQAGHTKAAMGWEQHTFANLSATGGTTELRFEGLDTSNGNYYGPFVGAALDDVSVVTATPEPSTYMLMGTGLLAIGGVVRRRRRTA